MVQTHRCTKVSKINAMEKSLTKLNSVVFERTNGDSLVSMAKHTIEDNTEIKADVRALLTFQTVVETEREIKQELREKEQVIKEKKARRQQWLIGLLIGTGLTLLGMVIALATKNTI